MHCRGKSDDAVRRDALGRKVTAVIMAKKKVKDAARDLLGDFLGEHSLELFNIEFVKEGRDRYLRVYIDKPEESGEYVSIDECELVSRYLSDRLDETDLIEDNYFLEVSSPGLDRPLLKDSDYVRYAGRMVDVSLYSAADGRKQISGELVSLKDGIVTIEEEAGKTVEIPIGQISRTKLAVIIYRGEQSDEQGVYSRGGRTRERKRYFERSSHRCHRVSSRIGI